MYAKAMQFWDGLSGSFRRSRNCGKARQKQRSRGKYRGCHGGHLLFRPVGLLLVTRVAVDLRSSKGLSDNAALERVGRTPTELSEHPWAGLLWDSANKRMITAKENQNIARRLLFNALGGDLSKAPYKLRPTCYGSSMPVPLIGRLMRSNFPVIRAAWKAVE